MNLKEISLINVRKLDFFKANFSPTTTIITGNNGQGKTSVLESIFFLLTSKSFRKKYNKSIIRKNENRLQIKEVFNDPQVIHSKIAETVNHPKLGKIKLVGQAMKLSRTPSKLKSAAPQKGEHTKDILTELGYSEDEINNLKMENAI